MFQTTHIFVLFILDEQKLSIAYAIMISLLIIGFLTNLLKNISILHKIVK